MSSEIFRRKMRNVSKTVVEVVPELESYSCRSFLSNRKITDGGGKQPCFDEFVNLMICMTQHVDAISCKGRYENLKLCIERK